MISISWNVNGIRAALKKGAQEFFNSSNADIIALQETKARQEQVEQDLPEYEYQYWNSAEKKGYSGVAVFSRKSPLNVISGIGIEKHDTEGRVLTLEFEQYYYVTVYTPNAKRGLERLDYRTREWDVDFLKYVQQLEKTKPVVFCGDLNVAHKEDDLANPKSNRKNAGFTDEERAGMDNIISAGFIDTFREFTHGNGHYSWWSFMARSRERNIGWRIDYFLISAALKPRLKRSEILSEVMGSDHAPVKIEIDL